MKGSCFFCNRFTGVSSGPEAKILVAQLACIDKGLLAAAEVIQAEVNKFYELYGEASTGTRKKSVVLMPAEEEKLMTNIGQIVAKYQKDNKIEEGNVKPVKNTFKLRDGLIKEFLKGHLVSHLRDIKKTSFSVKTQSQLSTLQ
jgi:hypothetical protein